MRPADQYARVLLFVDATDAGDIIASMCRLVTTALAGRMCLPVRLLPVNGHRPARVVDTYRRLLRAAAPLDRPVTSGTRSEVSGYLLARLPAEDVTTGSAVPALAALGRMRIVPVGRRTAAGPRVMEADLRDPVAAGRVLRRLADDLLAEATRPRGGQIAGALRGQWHASGPTVGRWARAALDVQNLGTRPSTTIRLRGAGLDVRPTVAAVRVSPIGTVTMAVEVRPWTTGAAPVEIRAANGDLGYAWLSGSVPA